MAKQDETIAQVPSRGQWKRVEQRFVLRVDGQTKQSFASLDEAVAADQKIKSKFPVVAVTVLDSENGSAQPVLG